MIPDLNNGNWGLSLEMSRTLFIFNLVASDGLYYISVAFQVLYQYWPLIIIAKLCYYRGIQKFEDLFYRNKRDIRP